VFGPARQPSPTIIIIEVGLHTVGRSVQLHICKELYDYLSLSWNAEFEFVNASPALLTVLPNEILFITLVAAATPFWGVQHTIRENPITVFASPVCNISEQSLGPGK
jgi:hypothetical protein